MRCFAVALQSRGDGLADHGGSGGDGACRKDRQERGTSSGGGREQKGRHREKRPARCADKRSEGHRPFERGQAGKTVRADGLSGRLASPDRPPARLARQKVVRMSLPGLTRQSIFLNRLFFRWMRGSSGVKTRLAL